ncbi:hypothetical protein VTO73DRAFT_7281 [Trametes versicolor]
MGADTTAAQHQARPRPSTLHPRCQVLSILRPAPVGPPEAPPPCERSSSNVQSPIIPSPCPNAGTLRAALSRSASATRDSARMVVHAHRHRCHPLIQGHAAVHGKIAGDSHPWSPRPIHLRPLRLETEDPVLQLTPPRPPALEASQMSQASTSYRAAAASHPQVDEWACLPPYNGVLGGVRTRQSLVRIYRASNFAARPPRRTRHAKRRTENGRRKAEDGRRSGPAAAWPQSPFSSLGYVYAWSPAWRGLPGGSIAHARWHSQPTTDDGPLRHPRTLMIGTAARPRLAKGAADQFGANFTNLKKSHIRRLQAAAPL